MRYRTVFGGAERSLGSRTVFGVVSFCHVPPSIIYNCIQWHTKQKFCPGWWSEMTFFIKNISKTAKIYEDLSLASNHKFYFSRHLHLHVHHNQSLLQKHPLIAEQFPFLPPPLKVPLPVEVPPGAAPSAPLCMPLVLINCYIDGCLEFIIHANVGLHTAHH